MQINCLVVDDEELARTLLENYIGRVPNLELVDKCKDPMDALQVLQQKKNRPNFFGYTNARPYRN